jgi:hypothetical protein
MQYLEMSRPVPQLEKIGVGIEWASLVKLIGKCLLYVSRQRIRTRCSKNLCSSQRNKAFKQFRTVLLTSTQMQYLEVSRPVPQLEKIGVGLGMGHILVKLMGNMMRQRIRAMGSEKTYTALRE